MTHIGVQRRRLSALETVFVKTVMPALWAPIFVVIVVADPLAFDATPWPNVKWLFVAFVLMSGAQILWYSARLKMVAMDGSCLFVRGLLSGEAAVPLSAVGQVRQRRFFDRLVTVTFSRDTDVGTRVVFLPRARPRLAIWREDAVVEELREAARRATASLTAP